METVTKEQVDVSLTEIRDGLIKNAQKIEKMDEADVQVYSNGVLDMYNNFIRVLGIKPVNDAGITYEV